MKTRDQIVAMVKAVDAANDIGAVDDVRSTAQMIGLLWVLDVLPPKFEAFQNAVLQADGGADIGLGVFNTMTDKDFLSLERIVKTLK